MEPCEWCDRETQLTCPECNGTGFVEAEEEQDESTTYPRTCSQKGGGMTHLLIHFLDLLLILACLFMAAVDVGLIATL